MGVCEYSTQLGSYLDGELDASRGTVLEAHLRDCADCDVELSQLRGLSRLITSATGPLLSSGAMGRLHQHVCDLEDDQEQAERAARRVLQITRVLTGIAACLLVAGSLWLTRSGAPESTKVADVTQSSAPWDVTIPPTTETPSVPSSDLAAPADATGNWMIGGLVSASSVTGVTGSAGEDGQP